MRFSLGKFMVIMVLISVVLCLSFAVPPGLGFLALTVVSLFVIPPALLVGVINTRGYRQSFFVGCMLAGIPHFVVSLYISIFTGMDVTTWSEVFDTSPPEDGESFYLRLFHLVGYIIGLIGGGSGALMYWLVQGSSEKEPVSTGMDRRLNGKTDQPFELHEPTAAADKFEGIRPK